MHGIMNMVLMHCEVLLTRLLIKPIDNRKNDLSILARTSWINIYPIPYRNPICDFHSIDFTTINSNFSNLCRRKEYLYCPI